MLNTIGMWFVANWLSLLRPTSNGEPRLVAAISPGKWILLNRHANAPSNWVITSSTRSWNVNLSPLFLCFSYKYLISLTIVSVSVSDSNL